MTTTPISPDRWDDVQRIFAGGGDGPGCQCMWPALRSKDYSPMPQVERQSVFRAEIGSARPPGLLLYADGDPAGWVRVGPRPLQKRLAHTRGLVETSGLPKDDGSVWAVTCFVVPREHRRQGITARLLDAAVDYARANGARVVEAYPLDPSRTKASANELFVGSVSTFTRAGFDVVGPLGTRKQVVQLAL